MDSLRELLFYYQRKQIMILPEAAERFVWSKRSVNEELSAPPPLATIGKFVKFSIDL